MAPQQTSLCGTQVLQRSLGRWHPALLLQEDQPVTCSQLGPGVSIWPGRIVGSHRPQLPSNIIPGGVAGQSMPADGMRTFPDAGSQAAMVRSLGVRSERGADSESAMASWRPNAAASACHSGQALGLPGLARQSSIARYDSASSEAFQQYSTVDPLTGLPPQPGAPVHAQLRCCDSGLEGTLQRHDSDCYSQLLRNPSGSLCLSSSEPSLGTKRSASLLWDSAQAEAFTSAIQAALQERRSSGSNCQADFWPGTDSRPCSAGSGSIHSAEHCQIWLASPAQARAPCHTLWTDERLRVPRRRRQPQQPHPGVRRCLLDEFTLAAEAEQWQLMSLEETQAASSPTRLDRAASVASPQLPNVPEDCMTSPQALMMSASPNDAWQPGRLREVMQGFPNGLPLEDARSVILNVAYGLQETHCDGVIHRRVCPSTVLVPDAPCCDTARLTEGGCTAVVDKTGTFTELERVGDLLYQAPEVQRACPGSKIVYSAAGDMWSLGVLMYVVLTGGVPPFAQSMARSSCRGMCTDALQQVVSGALHTGLDSSRPNSPYPRCAQVLLQALLQVDPAQRPTAAAVCRNTWALDLPDSPCDTLDCSTWDNPFQQTMPQEEPDHPRHESGDGPAEEQHAVECTSQAMQHLWLQQEALMNGGGSSQQSAEHMGRLLAAAHSGSAGRPGTYKGMLAWLQRFVGRCRRPEGRLPMHQASSQDLTELILQHY